MIAEKPELNEDLLIHFGVKGMKWGRRRKRPDEAQRGKVFSKANGVKLAKGAAVVAGVVLVAAVLTKSGRTKMVDVATSSYVSNRTAARTAKANPVTGLIRKFKDVKTASLPKPPSLSPAETQNIARLQLAQRTRRAQEEAQRFARSQAIQREGLNRLTDKTWRDQARMSRLISEMDSTTNGLLDGSLRDLTEASLRRSR